MNEDLLPSPSWVTGPTWQRTRDGGWHLPEKTLGWAVIAWMMEYLRQPGGDNGGEAFIPTDEQMRFLVWWYAVDHRGKFAYRSGVLRRLKGWGKDPLVAAMALAELCGPVAFSKWDEDGQPVGKLRSSAWIQVVAVSHDQTTNTFRVFPSMISPKLKEEHGLDINKTLIYSKAGGLIEAVTSSPFALEGKRPTFVILNEVQWWVETNDGHTMFKVVTGNVTKIASARYLAICNAHIPGMDSVGERLWDTYQKVVAGEGIDTGILYDALEAPPDTPVDSIPRPQDDPEGYAEAVKRLADGIKVARGDAYWLEPEALVAAILDPMNAISESVRMFLNWISATVDAWMNPLDWDSCKRDDLKLLAKDKITLGFDGSKTGDYTALVACRVSDGALFILKVWDPAQFPGGEIPREQVDMLVDWAFGRFEVVAFRADVKEFEAYVDTWGKKYKKQLKVLASPGNPVAFDMRGQTKRFAMDCEKFLSAAMEGELCHDGDKQLRVHILNSYRNPTTYDAISIRKESKDSTRKIDAAVCAVLAFGARQDYLMSKHGGRSGKVTVFG